MRTNRMQTNKPNSPPIFTNPIIACETGGGFQIGWHDDAPSFPSRSFAHAVASRSEAIAL